jgi:hypothetical protein
VDHLTLANNIFVLDGRGNLHVRFNVQDVANNNVLIEVLRKSKAIVTDSDSKQETLVTGESATPQEKPKSTSQLDDTKKLERQRGDLGLYRFYFFSSGIWQYLVWMLMAAINMLWSQMPCTTPRPKRLYCFSHFIRADIFLRIWLSKAPDDKTYFAGYAILGVTSCLSSAAMLA